MYQLKLVNSLRGAHVFLLLVAACVDPGAVRPVTPTDDVNSQNRPDISGEDSTYDGGDAPPQDGDNPIEQTDAIAPREGWRLVWYDEFEGGAGQYPDNSKWSIDIGGDGWGNQQLEYNTDRPANASLDGAGRLAIVARREYYGFNAYTSARLASRGRFSKAYGRFEASIRLPTGRGIWTAFWLLGSNVAEVSWPQCGEIDIMENKGQEPSIIRGSLHGPGYSGEANVGSVVSIPGGPLSDDFHLYAIEWDVNRIRWFVDDILFFEATPADLPPNTSWVYEHSFHIIFNVAVGGDFVGDPDHTTPFPQTMLVDYVRVYERVE